MNRDFWHLQEIRDGVQFLRENTFFCGELWRLKIWSYLFLFLYSGEENSFLRKNKSVILLSDIYIYFNSYCIVT